MSRVREAGGVCWCEMSTIGEPMTRTAEELWRRHAAGLLRFATVLVGPGDAHDVVVEAFVRAARSLPEVADGAHHSYLVRAVVSHAHDLRRARRRRWQRDLAAITPHHSTDDHLDLDVIRAVSRLSLSQRSVIYLVYWEDRTEREAAEILGVTPGTVRRHLVRARLNLRKALR